MTRRTRIDRSGPESEKPLRLYSGSMSIAGFDGPLVGAGRVSMAWEPRPRIELAVRGTRDLMFKTMRGDERTPPALQVKLGRVGQCVCDPFEWTFKSSDANAAIQIRGTVRPVAIGNPRAIHRVRAIAVNGPHVDGTFTLTGGGWRVTGTSRGYRSGRGTFHPTHDFEILREDEKPFQPNEAIVVLEALRHFLTLCRGAWTALVLPEGESNIGRRTWRLWDVPRIDEDLVGHGWLPWNEAGQTAIETAWTGYADRWWDPVGQATLKMLLPIYVEAATLENSEAALVVTQVFLELMSWISVVEERSLISEDGHDKLLASDRLRLLLKPININTSLPPEMEAIANIPGRSWKDGPHAVTEIRNAVAHPRKRRTFQSLSEVVAAARVISIDYATSAFLNYIGYSGPTKQT